MVVPLRPMRTPLMQLFRGEGGLVDEVHLVSSLGARPSW